MTENTNNGADKAPYSRPQLTVYGSVRNLTGGSVGSMNDGTGSLTLAMGMMSDPRAKENVVEVGRHPAGFGIYLFDYLPEFRSIGGEDGLVKAAKVGVDLSKEVGPLAGRVQRGDELLCEGFTLLACVGSDLAPKRFPEWVSSVLTGAEKPSEEWT